MSKYNIEWTDEILNFIKVSYPHFGSYEIELLYPNLNKDALRSKLNSMRIRLLPKKQRICFTCKKSTQYKRYICCKDCRNKDRYSQRREEEPTVKAALTEILRSAKYRSTIKSDLTVDGLMELYNKQQGKCFYSGLDMLITKHGTGRSPYSLSIDQITPSAGYLTNNIVLCCFCVNAGKLNLNVAEFLKVCSAINERKNLIEEKLPS